LPALQKETATIVVGLVLMALAAVGAAGTVELVSLAEPSTTVEVAAFGISIGRWTSSTLLWVTVGTAAATGFLLALGLWALAAARRRRAERDRERLVSEVERLKTMKRLLEQEVGRLDHGSRELALLGVASPRPDTDGWSAGDDVIVLPEAPPA
jgi:hypothetical protein